MNLRLGNTTSRTLRVLAGAALALTLSSYAGSSYAGSASASTAAPAAEPTLIVYSGGESPGVEVQSRADAKHLRGAPKAFKRFIGNKAQRLADRSTCSGGYVGVTVERVRTDGFAVGGVNDCGGYEALWAVVDGHWKQIDGSQEIWGCGVLVRHSVPSSIAGNKCYDYQDQKTRHYHQR